MLSSSSSVALTLVLLVTLTGELLLVSSSRDLIRITTDGLPADDHLLMMERFHGWMAKHGRSYVTTEEELRRFDIYRSNVEFIKAANRDGSLTYTLGENQFTDLTHEEFLTSYTSHGVPAASDLGREMVITTRAGDINEESCPSAGKDVPPHKNWTEQGKVTEVRDQKKCRSCWAFTAVATIESAYAIENQVAPLALSEQELIDCDTESKGCKSGEIDNAYNWVLDNKGLASRSDYPYRAPKKGECKKEEQHLAPIRDYKFVTRMCEPQLMAAVRKQPVAVLFDSTDRCFKDYKNGVYNGMCIKQGEYVGPCSSTNLEHSLTIVGYDDVEKYWIAKNSWGTGWGDQGYVKLKKDVGRSEGLCGLARKPVYPIPANKKSLLL